MADKKISALTAATTPLDGTEVLPIVQSGATVKVVNNDLRPKQIQSNATSGVLQVAGPAATSTRVMTVPDANFTAARTDAAQTFTGNQKFYNTIDTDVELVARGGVVTLGDVYPGIDNNGWNIGKASNRWTTIYAATALINTSDGNQKQQIDDLTTQEKAVATSIKSLIKTFKLNDSVAEKGNNARIHVGVIAQDLQSAFKAQNLDANCYAMFCSDTWYEVNGKAINETGNAYTKDSEGAVEVTRLGVRYEQLLAFVIAAL
jgi:hypothetical protein